MNIKEEINGLIKKYEEPKDFSGGVSEELIKQSEELLGGKFPEGYRWFLKNYGSGGILGIEHEGVIPAGRFADMLDGESTVVTRTLAEREFSNLPKGLIFIESIDEFMYGLSLEDGKIYYWDWTMDEDGKDYRNYERGKDYLSFLYEEIQDSIENLD